MKVTLVRHGQTESNYEGVCQGRSNNLLNDTGRRQCQRLRDKLKNKHFDVCFMSPLIRTVETAMILIGDRVEMIPEKRLIERDLGRLEGKPREDYDCDKYWDYNLNSGDEDVEKIHDLFQRCREFVDYLKEAYHDKEVLVVSHSAVVRAIRHILLGTDLTKNLWTEDIENCYCEEIEV